MENQPKKGFGRAIQISLLLFIVVISPALSWYYLKSGVNYRKNSLSELKDYGAMDFLDWKLINNKTLALDSLKGHIVIVNIVNPNTVEGAKNTAITNKVFDQFKDRRDVIVATFLTQTDSVAALAYAKKNNPRAYANYWFSTTSGENQQQLLKGLKLSQKGDFSTSECPYLTYINMQGVVSSFYDINDNLQLGRLIEHIAMKLTIDPFKTPEIKRDKEK